MAELLCKHSNTETHCMVDLLCKHSDMATQYMTEPLLKLCLFRNLGSEVFHYCSAKGHIITSFSIPAIFQSRISEIAHSAECGTCQYFRRTLLLLLCGIPCFPFKAFTLKCVTVIDKTPTHALFIQHYISLAC